MKRLAWAALVLALAVALAGCGSSKENDAAKIEALIYEYASCLLSRDWQRATSLTTSDYYYISAYYSVTKYDLYNVQSISVTVSGNLATAVVTVHKTFTIGSQTFDETRASMWYFIKSGDTWLIDADRSYLPT